MGYSGMHSKYKQIYRSKIKHLVFKPTVLVPKNANFLMLRKSPSANQSNTAIRIWMNDLVQSIAAKTHLCQEFSLRNSKSFVKNMLEA